MTLKRSPCNSCGAPLLWARTANGILAPLDAEPVPDGNISLDENGTCRVLPKADLFAAEEKPAGPLYKSHFATCAHAAKHRRKRQ